MHHLHTIEDDKAWSYRTCLVSPSLSFLNSVSKTHNSNSKPTITQKLQNFCLLTKPSHISQLLSPPFVKMKEPTDQFFSIVFLPTWLTWRTWNPHPNPVSSPPPMTKPNSTTINTTNIHTKNPKECTRNPQPNPTSPKKKKNNAEQKKNPSKKMELRLKTMKRWTLLLQLLLLLQRQMWSTS